MIRIVLFFATDRGKNAIKYAMQKAVALINYSARYIEIDFCVWAKDYLSININDQVTIQDLRFLKGHITGKVIKTKFIANANQKIVKITIGCCSKNFENDCFEKLKSYKIEIEQDDNKINPADIVTNIEIKNSPDEQIDLLSQMDAKNISQFKDELKKHVTKIKISLHPLNTTRAINREINLSDFCI